MQNRSGSALNRQVAEALEEAADALAVAEVACAIGVPVETGGWRTVLRRGRPRSPLRGYVRATRDARLRRGVRREVAEARVRRVRARLQALQRDLEESRASVAAVAARAERADNQFTVEWQLPDEGPANERRGEGG
ncbi:MAG: hypothetical protein M0Z94_18230 [Dehalococcoidales bacterium]|nr:hypothetical protein [Dehalococcoidales bacterium]